MGEPSELKSSQMSIAEPAYAPETSYRMDHVIKDLINVTGVSLTLTLIF